MYNVERKREGKETSAASDGRDRRCRDQGKTALAKISKRAETNVGYRVVSPTRPAEQVS